MKFIPTDLPGQDAELQAMPTDMLADLATHAESDLYYFAQGVLGYSDLAVKCHQPLCIFVTDNSARFKMILIPRGHYKTTIVTISRTLQMVCRNVNSRILIANETSTNAERFLGAIKSQCEGNRRFRTLFGHVLPPDTKKVRWSNKELIFNREWHGPEPTIDTIGMTGAWTSRHYTHIDFDDPISEEAAKSDLVMQDVITRVSKVYSLMTDTGRDTFTLVGTRWAFFDVYTWMHRWMGEKMAKFIRGALEDGEPIFPEKFSLETLADIRNSPQMGEYMFSCQYMNNPRNPELQDFNVNDIRFWRWSSDEDHVVMYDHEGEVEQIVELDQIDIVCTLDPAPSERITSDRNALVVSGVTPSGDVVVLHVWAQRCTPLEVIEEMFRIKARFNPRVFGVEKHGYQSVLKYFIDQEAERRGEYLNIVDLKPGKKKAHIKGLQPIASTGHLYLLPTQHILRNELSEYPLGEHDDTADALALGQQLWRGLMSPERMKKYKEFEQSFIHDIDDYGLRSERAGVPWNGHSRNPQDIPHPDDLDYERPQPEIHDYILDV